MNNRVQIKHKEAVAKLFYLLGGKTPDVIQLGNKLVELGIDKITDGFWIWNTKTNVEYYSPEFRKSLGFDNEQDFPNVPESWQNQIISKDAERGLDAYYKHLEDPDYPYFLDVTYRKKGNKQRVKLICAGTIVNRGDENPIMLGTHEIYHI